MTQPTAPAGWYPDEHGVNRYWDGTQWAAPQAPGTAPAHKKKGGWVLAVIVAIVAVLVIAAVNQDDNSGGGGGTTTSSTHHIVYLIDGTATGADITYITSDGGTSQEQGVSIPLTGNSGTGLRFTMNTGQFMYISAQINGDGTLTCRITDDGIEVSHNTASGLYAIATCNGQA